MSNVLSTAESTSWQSGQNASGESAITVTFPKAIHPAALIITCVDKYAHSPVRARASVGVPRVPRVCMHARVIVCACVIVCVCLRVFAVTVVCVCAGSSRTP